jgi:L-lactate dehydrogenase complex protein LldG
LDSQVADLWRRVEQDRPALLEQLAATAALRGWQVFRNPEPAQAISYLENLITKLGITQVALSNQEALREVPVAAALTQRGIAAVTINLDQDHSRAELRQAIIESGLGITGVDYAVAETGSVVVLPRAGLSRLISVVPPVHVALVRPAEVLASLDDVFLLRLHEYHRNGGDMGSYLNFITGPSRTADIEQTLVVGVHGPREVHLVLLG